ncbi:hypothetical protein Hanom_Chr16g01475681 [Helianthus anomalus]
MLNTYGIYKINYIITLRFAYEKLTAFALHFLKIGFRPHRFCALPALLNQGVSLYHKVILLPLKLSH